MSFKPLDSKEAYTKDYKLKPQDVQALLEWSKKQPHLPELTERQVIVFLDHSCYRIEPAKTVIDNYFTIRTRCPDLFHCPSEDIIRNTLSVESMVILPKKTPEGYIILATRLLDFRPERYININHLKVASMILTLYFYQHGPIKGLVCIFDTKGTTLSHLARANLTAVKQILYFVQEAAPVRVKSIHYVNVVPLTEKLLAFIRPFMKKELFNLMHLHPGSLDGLYKYIPKQCLPEDYDGELPSLQILHEQSTQNVIDNLDFFKWHDTQKVDESRRVGPPKIANTIFGVDGTFKKLEID